MSYLKERKNGLPTYEEKPVQVITRHDANAMQITIEGPNAIGAIHDMFKALFFYGQRDDVDLKKHKMDVILEAINHSFELPKGFRKK